MRSYLGKDYEAGLAAADRALLLAPNSALVLLLIGWLRAYIGDAPTAIAHLERAMRLSPVDPAMFYLVHALGLAHFVAGHYEQAAELAHRAIHDGQSICRHIGCWRPALAQLGRLDEAGEAIRALLAVAPGYTFAAAVAHLGLRDPASRKIYLDGLQQVGCRSSGDNGFASAS